MSILCWQKFYVAKSPPEYDILPPMCKRQGWRFHARSEKDNTWTRYCHHYNHHHHQQTRLSKKNSTWSIYCHHYNHHHQQLFTCTTGKQTSLSKMELQHCDYLEQHVSQINMERFEQRGNDKEIILNFWNGPSLNHLTIKAPLHWEMLTIPPDIVRIGRSVIPEPPLAAELWEWNIQSV